MFFGFKWAFVSVILMSAQVYALSRLEMQVCYVLNGRRDILRNKSWVSCARKVSHLNPMAVKQSWLHTTSLLRYTSDSNFMAMDDIIPIQFPFILPVLSAYSISEQEVKPSTCCQTKGYPLSVFSVSTIPFVYLCCDEGLYMCVRVCVRVCVCVLRVGLYWYSSFIRHITIV